jgi:hypothetical protein
MHTIESFSTVPLQNIIPSYLYWEYSDDSDLQAFVSSQNSLAQGYLEWFNQTPLALYTSPSISGPLLDWVGQGIYGIKRPVLASETSSTIAGYNSAAYDTVAYNSLQFFQSGTASIADDDIYKRVLTWNTYRGDGEQFTMGWLKNRVGRFINGANGSDWPVLNNPPFITVSGNVFTIQAFATTAFTSLTQCANNNELALPFQYVFNFEPVFFINDGGVLQMTSAIDYPVDPTGLPVGAIWFNGGTLGVVPTTTPNPAAPPVFFNAITPAILLALTGSNLPLTNPGVTGQLWNNGGVISIS